MAHPVPQTIDAILDEAKAAIIHVSDVAPLMKSTFALADGDLDAMDAVEGISDRPAKTSGYGREA